MLSNVDNLNVAPCLSKHSSFDGKSVNEFFTRPQVPCEFSPFDFNRDEIFSNRLYLNDYQEDSTYEETNRQNSPSTNSVKEIATPTNEEDITSLSDQQ